MALSSIPQFRPVSPEEASPIYAAMKSFIPMYQQAQQQKMQQQAMQQQQQQMGLKSQLAQMQADRESQMAPFKQRKLEAETGLAEAKTSGFPQQAQQQQAKMALSWAQNVMKANSDDPNFSKDPANQQSLARAMQIQNAFLGNMQGAQQQSILGNQQGAPAQSGLSDLSGSMLPQEQPQEQTQPQLSPEYLQSIQAAQKAQEGKRLKEQYTPDELNRISRIIPAKRAYDQAKIELQEIAPYLGPGQSLKRAAENMASSSGIPLSDATIKINTFFNKTIKGLAKEMGPGFGVPTAEKAYKEFEKYINPQSFGQPDQIMANFEAVGGLLDNVGKTLLKTPAQQIEQGKALFGQDVPRGTQDAQGGNTINYGGQTYTREQLMKIAGGGQ
jgi:hypothetical protein